MTEKLISEIAHAIENKKRIEIVRESGLHFAQIRGIVNRKNDPSLKTCLRLLACVGKTLTVVDQ